MSQAWQERAKGINDRFLQLAKSKGSLKTAEEITHYFALAICGEAGELANLVKKEWRGDTIDPVSIRDELADIRIYLEHLSRHLGIDLDQACSHKLDEVAARLTKKESA